MAPVLFINGRFWPAEPDAPEPRALLARDGRIEALALTPPELGGPGGAEVIDLEGRIAVPGPVDAHCHLVSYGMIRLREADLRGARSLDDLRQRLHEHAALLKLRTGEDRWLLGRAFDQDLLAERRWPDRRDLDAIAPDIPLRITRVCGHALVANTAALRRAGLEPDARHGGFPEGVLTENAMAPIYQAIPQPGPEEWLEAARWACREAARVGFVGVHSLMAHAAEIRALVDLRREGPLPVRVRMQLPYALLEHAAALGLRTGYGDDYLRIGAVKLFSDGSLGARTAALLGPYTDDPGTAGELIYEPEELTRRVRRVFDAGFQVCIHAIGDRAMQVTLDAVWDAPLRADGSREGWAFPPRIEHASLISPAILGQMRELGVGAAIQPQFAHSDYWTPERLGTERARWCYAFRSLCEAAIPLAGSTDCPVETLDAMAAIGQLVHRPEWSPDEGLPLDTTLRIFSEGSYALDGRRGGRLAEGEPADFLVLEEDPRAVPPAEIQHVPVAMTIVGGQVAHPDRPS
jgi:predicted amidohydrolase YtcJ